MQIFIDTANLDEIKQVNDWGILDGVTTNPSLVAKEKDKGKDFRTIVKEICEIVAGDVSAEVVAIKYEEILAEGRALAKIHKNIVVKVPLTQDGLKAVKTFAKEGIRCNVTLCFSANQALLAAKAGASIISPFIGRLDDMGEDGMTLIAEIMEVWNKYDFETEVLVASTRHPRHIVDAAMLGAHISTIPYDLFKKLPQHGLTDTGIKKFQEDWAKVTK